MIANSNGSDQNRRADVRLASGRKIDAVVLDQHAQPVILLRDTEATNVSAGGLMMLSEDSVELGTRVEVRVVAKGTNQAKARRFTVRTIACSPHGEQKHRIHCQVVQGAVPADLIYGW